MPNWLMPDKHQSHEKLFFKTISLAETAEATAAGEVAAATTAEVAADASEAADWWTIIGGIISGAAIAAAAAALAAAITKHNDAVKVEKQAQDVVNGNKTALRQKQLTKKQAELKVQHEKDVLTIKQKQLKEAKEKEQDAQDVKDALNAAHVGIEKIGKKIKERKTSGPITTAQRKVGNYSYQFNTKTISCPVTCWA
jgi:hypothetical protein